MHAVAMRNPGLKSGVHMSACSISVKSSRGSRAYEQRVVVMMGTAMTKCRTVLTRQCTALYKLKSRKGYSTMSNGAVRTVQLLVTM